MAAKFWILGGVFSFLASLLTRKKPPKLHQNIPDYTPKSSKKREVIIDDPELTRNTSTRPLDPNQLAHPFSTTTTDDEEVASPG